jgi:hypothetical protein
MDILQDVRGTEFANNPDLNKRFPVMWTCNLEINQRYSYVKATQQIVTASEKLCLSVLNGFAPRLETCNANSALQKWKFEPNGFISNVSLKTCLAANTWVNNGALQLGSCTPSNGNQISLATWKVVDATTRMLSPAHAANMCMDFNPQYREFPVLWQCDGLSFNQRFEFLPSFNGKTMVRHPPTNKCLDMAYQSMAFRDCDTTSRTQEFSFTGRDSILESFGLQGKCVDVRGGASGNDARIDQYQCNRNANQRWTAK